MNFRGQIINLWRSTYLEKKIYGRILNSIYLVFFFSRNAKKTYTDQSIPVDTRRKLNVHKTFRRRPRRLLSFLCTFNLRPVSTGILRFFLRLTNLQKWQLEETFSPVYIVCMFLVQLSGILSITGTNCCL